MIKKNISSQKAFTLIELLIVIGILAVLATVVLLVLNPAQMVKQSRDVNRITELNQINQALQIYESFGGIDMGTHNTVYVSLPSSNANCLGLGLPALGGGYTYACSNSANYRKTDSTGWLPVDFASVQSSAGSLFSVLPIDPVNTVANGYYYTYIPGSWALSATMESTKFQEANAAVDGGQVSGRFEVGNELSLNTTIISSKTITSFSFSSPSATGIINETNHTIAVSVPYGTNITALVATFTTTGASVKVGPTTQTSGSTPNNFTDPVTYTVTATDNSTQNYIVTVTVEAFSATGGTITEIGGYRIHTFTSSGIFTPNGPRDVEVLVVAGGGAGGGGNYLGGGGGAGGVLYDADYTVTGAISVVVGAGGAGTLNTIGASGQNSTFGILVAVGGGGGGLNHSAGTSGGSGGGGSGLGAGGSGTNGQGYAGGHGYYSGSWGCGGGGGAGGVGADGLVVAGGGAGGVGLSYSISGVATYYGGGGGGGTVTGSGGAGGLGGGGAGSTSSGGDATPNTGGGGGGAERNLPAIGGDGGSGIVIVRYPL